MRDSHCDRCLADATRANDGDESLGHELGRERLHIISSSDHSSKVARQVGLPKTEVYWASRRHGRFRSRYGCNKAVAPSRQRHYVACAVFAVAKRLAQAGDVKP